MIFIVGQKFLITLQISRFKYRAMLRWPNMQFIQMKKLIRSAFIYRSTNLMLFTTISHNMALKRM